MINAYKILIAKPEGKETILGDLRIYGMIILKLKINSSLCLTKYNAMKTHWGNRGIAPRILNLRSRGS